jgi:hypothetical protein
MSVVCLRPPKFVGDVPRSLNQAIGRADLHRSLEEALQHRFGARLGDLSPPGHLVQRRTRLRHHELWRKELVPAQAGEAHGRMARGDRHRRVNNQDLRQWPLRERWSAATQLGAGVPSSPTRHSSGNSDIGCSSSSIARTSRSSIACLVPTRRAGRRPERIHRRTVSGFLPSRSAASATVNMKEMVRQAPDLQTPTRATCGHQGATRHDRPTVQSTLQIDSAACQQVPAPRNPHEAGRGTRDVGSQSGLDRGPNHRLPQGRLNGSMDVLGSHRLVPIGQHLDDSLQHPAWPLRPLPTGHSLPSRFATGPHGGQFLDQTGQRPL